MYIIAATENFALGPVPESSSEQSSHRITTLAVAGRNATTYMLDNCAISWRYKKHRTSKLGWEWEMMVVWLRFCLPEDSEMLSPSCVLNITFWFPPATPCTHELQISSSFQFYSQIHAMALRWQKWIGCSFCSQELTGSGGKQDTKIKKANC